MSDIHNPTTTPIFPHVDKANIRRLCQRQKMPLLINCGQPVYKKTLAIKNKSCRNVCVDQTSDHLAHRVGARSTTNRVTPIVRPLDNPKWITWRVAAWLNIAPDKGRAAQKARFFLRKYERGLCYRCGRYRVENLERDLTCEKCKAHAVATRRKTPRAPKDKSHAVPHGTATPREIRSLCPNGIINGGAPLELTDIAAALECMREVARAR